MAGSITDALAGTGMIPPVNESQLKPPANMQPDADEAAAREKKESISGIVKKGEAEAKPLADKYERDAKNMPILPTVENGMLKAAPKPDTSNDPIKGYVSAIGLLGAIGSMFTRRPLTTAMNASAGVLQAIQSQDAADLKQKTEVWKAENDNALKLLDYQQAMYKDVLANDKWSLEEKRAQTSALAAAFKDDYTLQNMREKRDDDHEKMLADTAKLYAEAKEHSAKAAVEMVPLQEFMDAKSDIGKKVSDKQLTKEQAKPLYTAALKEFQAARQKSSGKAGAEVTLSESAIAQKGRALVGGASYSDVGLSMRSGSNADRDAVDEWIAANHPNFDRAAAVAGQAGRRANLSAQGRREGTTAQASEELDALAEPTRNSLHKLQKSNSLGKYPDLNLLRNSIAYRTGDPDIVEAINNVQELQNAYTALLIRGGQRSDEAQRLSGKLIKDVFSPEQSDRAIDTILANSKRIMSGLEKARKKTLGEESSAKAIPEEAIAMLKADPSSAPSFDETFGAGAAKGILGR